MRPPRIRGEARERVMDEGRGTCMGKERIKGGEESEEGGGLEKRGWEVKERKQEDMGIRYKES